MESRHSPLVGSGWRSIHQVAADLGKSLRLVRNWCSSGRLRYSKIGALIFISDDDFDEFIRSHARGGNRDKSSRHSAQPHNTA
jgi:Helix-turn-helix domain